MIKNIAFEARLSALDLTPIINKLTDEREDICWSSERVLRVAESYRQYLSLKFYFPSETIVPTKEVDTFWHTHILDTRKYAKDCDSLFGSFLHHFPYFGSRGVEDRRNLEQAFSQTRELYRLCFNSDPGLLRNDLDSWAAGCNPDEIRAAGCNPDEIRAAGCNPDEIRAAGCNPDEIRAAGCNPDEIRAAGCNPDEIRAAGCNPDEIRAAGCNPDEIRAAGCNPDEIKFQPNSFGMNLKILNLVCRKVTECAN
ncbi:hypothetical protein [Microcoleus sp. Pol12B5]|uniref:hypothetical protein n=1 Tax=Microcoleus sp. Pol12B5 TaxID=3055396 RepID=UPI002FCEFF40